MEPGLEVQETPAPGTSAGHDLRAAMEPGHDHQEDKNEKRPLCSLHELQWSLALETI